MCFSIGCAHTAASAMSAASNAGSRYSSTGETAAANSAITNAVPACMAIRRFTRSVTTKGFLSFSFLARANSSAAIAASSARQTNQGACSTAGTTPAAAIATPGISVFCALRLTLR